MLEAQNSPYRFKFDSFSNFSIRIAKKKNGFPNMDYSGITIYYLIKKTKIDIKNIYRA